MVERVNKSEKAQKSAAEKFKELYNAEMTEIAYEDLPQCVRDHFEKQSRKFIHPDVYRVGDFSKLYCFSHRNGDRTYVGQQDKIYDTNKSTERLAYFSDTRDGKLTGYLEMRLALTDLTKYFKNKPFVGFSRTEPSFTK